MQILENICIAIVLIVGCICVVMFGIWFFGWMIVHIMDQWSATATLGRIIFRRSFWEYVKKQQDAEINIDQK